jgi:hypothetical protein
MSPFQEKTRPALDRFHINDLRTMTTCQQCAITIIFGSQGWSLYNDNLFNMECEVAYLNLLLNTSIHLQILE